MWKESKMEKYVLSVVNTLTLKDIEVLLGIACSTKEGRLGHKRYPDILGADVTYRDNNEKHPHIRLIGKISAIRTYHWLMPF